MAATVSFVHFEVEGDRLGLSLEDVTEIATVARITPVPRSPDFVVGLANIRGRVVTLLDAGVLFGAAEPLGAEGAGQAVVLAAPREHLALFTRSKVDIGRGRESSSPASGKAPEREGRPPLEGLVVMDNAVVRLIPPQGLQVHCESRVMERYRRRA